MQNEIYNSNKSQSMWKVIRRCVSRKEITELNYSRNVEELAEEFNVTVFFTSMGLKQQRLQLNLLPLIISDISAELQKSHGYAGITREEGLQNGQSVRKVSCQHTT